MWAESGLQENQPLQTCRFRASSHLSDDDGGGLEETLMGKMNPVARAFLQPKLP